MESETNESQSKETTQNAPLSTANQGEALNENKDNFLDDKIIIKNESNTPISDEFQLLPDDFEFFSNHKEFTKDLENLEIKLEQINIEEGNNLEEVLKEHIKDLEEFSSILNLEDLIEKPDYTFNLLMKSLKRIINFKYFYTRFTIPKDKNKSKGERKNQAKKSKQDNNINNNKEFFEKKRDNFILKLSERTKELKDNNSISSQNNNINQNTTENSIGKINLFEESLNISQKSLSKISKGNNSTISGPNEPQSDGTLSKIEEYKLLNYDTILPIIQNNALTDDDEFFFEGKNYESNVRRYFKIVLDICKENSLTVYRNPSQSINGFYIFYEDLLKKDENKKINLIKGKSDKNSDYNFLEFDLMVDNVNSRIIKEIINIFKSSIIAKNFDENVKDNVNFQIVGEIAKNLLNQSIDKIKQIGKIIDVLLIDQNLKIEDLNSQNNNLQYELISEYINLKLNVKQNKVIFLFTNGSFLDLRKAVIFDLKEIEEASNDYDKIKINSVFPISNKRRYVKNMIYFKNILDILNNSKLPYIIFYVGEEINNRAEKTLINYIKNNKRIDKYKEIISKIEKNEELISTNISRSFIIKTINKNLKKINKEKIFNVIQSIYVKINEDNIKNYSEFLFSNLIEKKKNEYIQNILVFYISSNNKNYIFLNNEIKKFNENNILTFIKLKYVNKDNLYEEYSKFSKTKIFKTYIIIDNKDKSIFDLLLKLNLDFDVKTWDEFLDINFPKINYETLSKILKNYILPHFAHFREEGFMNSKLLHKKIIYDFNNLKENLPIKIKELSSDIEIKFIENIQKIINDSLSNDIITKKSEEILLIIKGCIGDNIYQFLISKHEKSIKLLIEKNLKSISEHIICYYIYEKFFIDYVFNKIQDNS